MGIFTFYGLLKKTVFETSKIPLKVGRRFVGSLHLRSISSYGIGSQFIPKKLFGEVIIVDVRRIEMRNLLDCRMVLVLDAIFEVIDICGSLGKF